MSARIVPVYFNHGGRRQEVAYLEVKLGKAFLVTRIHTLLQTNRVHLPESEEARILAEELMEYEIKVSDVNDMERPLVNHEAPARGRGASWETSEAGAGARGGSLRRRVTLISAGLPRGTEPHDRAASGGGAV